MWYSVYPSPWKGTYGDGGRVEVSYNASQCSPLNIPSEVHTSLKQNIQRLASKRNDVQENHVVEDIVDPDLYPRIIHPQERVRMHDACLGVLTKSTLWNSACRGSYCWIPTDVEVTGPTSVRFTSPIHNLPHTPSNHSMYECLTSVLGAMLPGLRNTLGLPSLARFQVVVKVQRYKVPAGSTYSGQWHTEGVTEDVAAVGVYYAEWPSQLRGGELKFRLLESPDEGYRYHVYAENYSDQNDGFSISVPVSEGSALVFSNELPHRFRRLTNDTDTLLHRAFINFFVIDPKKPKPSTLVIPTNADIYLCLHKLLVNDVIAVILEFLSLTPSSHAFALDLRKKAKAEMVEMKGKWGAIHHGNCGTLHWLSERFPRRRTIKEDGEYEEEDYEEEDYLMYDDTNCPGEPLRCFRYERDVSHTQTSSARDNVSIPGV